MAIRKSFARKSIADLREQPSQVWLDLVLTPEHKRKVDFEHYRFPSDRHAAEILGSTLRWTEVQAKRLLRCFLIPSGSLGHDTRVIRQYSETSNSRLGEDLENVEFIRRLFYHSGPWEGITWVLDLLPSNPAKAIEVLEAYYIAHCQYLPDGRADGLFDAMSVIRKHYFQAENDREALSSLTPTEFEFLIAALYKRMGYAVQVTRASKDGGVDILANKDASGSRATIFIQCKHYSKNVRVQALRELTGLVLKHHANKGVLIASFDFTKGAKNEASATSTIELIGFTQLNILLNQHLGADWPRAMSYEIRSMQYECDSRLKAMKTDA